MLVGLLVGTEEGFEVGLDVGFFVYALVGVEVCTYDGIDV